MARNKESIIKSIIEAPLNIITTILGVFLGGFKGTRAKQSGRSLGKLRRRAS
jgi:hypothetical protein